MIRFTASPVVISAQDGDGRREIMGVAAPYNVEATVSDGTTVKFLPGSLPVDGAAPKLIQNHDLTQAIGVVTERTEDENGVYFVARISKTAAGNDALELAKDGVLDAVSVGAEPIDAEFDDNGTLVVASARWVELSLVPIGAFPEARITQVAAAKEKENTMSETPNAKVETVAAPVEVPAAAPSAPVWTVKPDREFPMPTPGEYIAAMHIGGEAWRQVNAAYKQNIAKSRTAIQAALAQDLTTDTPGILPIPVLGPVFEDLNFVRPVVSALGTRAMPNGNGKSFIRPTITQHTTAGVQTEGLAVSSQKMTIASNSVTRQTVAGGVFISQQDIDFTDPSALESILRDLSGQYLIKTDDIAADALRSAATASGATWTVTGNQTDPSSLITALYGAAVNIQAATNFVPTHVFCSSNVWELLGRQLDADKRPVFGYTSGSSLIGTNTIGSARELSYLGTNVMGLQLIVDNNFAANTLLVVRADGFECYENVRGIMTKEDPELLGRNFTYYGYFATFATDATMIQSIALA